MSVGKLRQAGTVLLPRWVRTLKKPPGLESLPLVGPRIWVVVKHEGNGVSIRKKEQNPGNQALV